MAQALAAEGLGKRYRTGLAGMGYGRLSESISNAARSAVRLGKTARLPRTHRWALRDVSLQIDEGEVVGVIGRNGAGKTTLLKIIAGITEPTEGRLGINGRVGSLLEVGTGFHPELTGRENIMLNGAILGMRRHEIVRKFDDIVEFAETGAYLDTPVKRYSSGMYVRLRFAVAAHLEPEILIVDEVLAVGDAAFQKKSLSRMDEAGKGGRTVLFVSHNMGMVARLCQRVIWIDDGQVRRDGPANAVISEYLTADAVEDAQRTWPGGIARPDVSEFRLDSITVRGFDGEVASSQPAHLPFAVEIAYRVLEPLGRCRVGFSLAAADGTTLFETYDADYDAHDGPREPGSFVSTCTIPGQLLKPGRYFLSINAGMPPIKNLYSLDNVLLLNVEESGYVGSNVPADRGGIIRPFLDWRLDKIA